MSSKTLSFQECMIVNPWYKCPLAFIVFCLFILLFAYSIYMMVVNQKKIQYYTDKIRSEDTDTNVHQLKRFETLFIINIIGTFLSFAVVVLFLGKGLEHFTFMKIFNKYLILMIIIFLIVVTSWNIHIYSTTKDDQKHTGVQVTNSIILGLSCLIILCVILFYFYGDKIKGQLPSPSKQQ